MEMDSCVLTCYCGAVFPKDDMFQHLAECEVRRELSPVADLMDRLLSATDVQQLEILEMELRLGLYLVEHRLNARRNLGK